jgi:hypothetical protein
MVDEKGKQQSNPGGMTVDGKLAKKQHINGTKKMNKLQTAKKCIAPPGLGERGMPDFCRYHTAVPTELEKNQIP